MINYSWGAEFSNFDSITDEAFFLSQGEFIFLYHALNCISYIVCTSDCYDKMPACKGLQPVEDCRTTAPVWASPSFCSNSAQTTLACQTIMCVYNGVCMVIFLFLNVLICIIH